MVDAELREALAKSVPKSVSHDHLNSAYVGFDLKRHKLAQV
jgi:hypothetical protein